MLRANSHGHQSELQLLTHTKDAPSQPQKDSPRNKTDVYSHYDKA